MPEEKKENTEKDQENDIEKIKEMHKNNPELEKIIKNLGDLKSIEKGFSLEVEDAREGNKKPTNQASQEKLEELKKQQEDEKEKGEGKSN